MKKIVGVMFVFIFTTLFLTEALFANTTKDKKWFKATAKIAGEGSVSFVLDGIYKIKDNTKSDNLVWSNPTNEGGYLQSDCYVAFVSTVTQATARIRIYTDVKNQNTYDPSVSSYTGTVTNYFNGLVGQGEEQSSYAVLPMAWHASTYTCTSAEDLTVEGNVSSGTYKYSFMIDKSDHYVPGDEGSKDFETNTYSTVQWTGHGLRVLDDPVGGYYAVSPGSKNYIYIGCNFANAMPKVEYTSVIILEAFVE